MGAGLLDYNKRAVERMPVNPMDKSTIISIYPRDITEKNHTLTPGVWNIKAGTYEKPSFTIVGPSSWLKSVDIDEPLLEIPVNSLMIAESVVRDYSVGLFGYQNGVAMPGLFYLPGEINLVELKKNHQKLLDGARIRQKRWFENLIKFADAAWSKSPTPYAISDDMKLAAAELGIDKDKPWMKDQIASTMTNCPACGSLRNEAYPVCSVCHTIVDVERYKQMGLVKAGA